MQHYDTNYKSKNCTSVLISDQDATKTQKPLNHIDGPLRCSPAVRAQGRFRGGPRCAHGGPWATEAKSEANKDPHLLLDQNLLLPICNILKPFADHRITNPLLYSGQDSTEIQRPLSIPNWYLRGSPAARAQGLPHGGHGCS